MADSAGSLSSRAVRGMLLANVNMARLWWATIVQRVTSDQLAGEDFGLIGGPGQMSESNGSIEGKEPKVFPWFIRNKHFELAARIRRLEFLKANHDKLNQWLQSHMVASGSHPGLLLKELINAAESATCFDGTAFFNASHPVDGGTQSNLLTETVVDKSALTDKEVSDLLMGGIARLFSLTDNAGNAINENIQDMVITTNETIWKFLFPVVQKMYLSGGGSNPIVPNQRINVQADGFNFNLQVKLVPNMQADTFDMYAGGMADGGPFIWQVLEDNKANFLGPDSEYCQINDYVLLKLMASYNMAYGRYMRAVRTKISNA